MKKNLLILLASSLMLIACGGNSDSSGNQKASQPVTPKPTTPKPVTPNPVTPEPVTPKPVTPEPTTPNPVTPQPVAPKPATPKPVTNAQAWLDAHNVYRKKHQVADLQWSNTLANSAQTFVNSCPSKHSGSGYGENMAWASYKQTANKVVGRWYAEENKHDYSKGYQGSSGHFTQLIWKNTTEVGCAQASSCGGNWADVVVCQYNPAGNYLGQFGNNVFPPN